MDDSKLMDSDSFKPYIHQVAGHLDLTGLLSGNDGCVLKPVQQPPKGERERDFYEWLYRNKDHTNEVLELRTFLPKYFGTVELKSYTGVNSKQYLKLEDITNNFRRPCILDVKMGRVTWDHTANQEKINSRQRKLPLQSSLGFSILGFKVYNHTSGLHESTDKCVCKSWATVQEVNQGFAAYLKGAADEKKAAITQKIIARLLDIKKLFEKQRTLKFIASSLLIVYEGDVNCHMNLQETKMSSSSDPNAVDTDTSQSKCTSQKPAEEKCLTPNASLSAFCDKCQEIEVRMIDMAHVFESSEIDENYIFGLSSLISHFERQNKIMMID